MTDHAIARGDLAVVRAAIQGTQRLAKETGTTVPKAITTGLADLAAHMDDATKSATPGPDDLGRAIRAAVAGGRSLTEDPEVLRLSALTQLRKQVDMDGLMKQIRLEREAALLKQHTPELVKMWRGIVAGISEDLTKAIAEIDERVSFTDIQSASALNPDRMALWAKARAALNIASRLTDTWKLLARSTGNAQVVASDEPLILADLTLADLDALGNRPTPDVLIRAGHALELATPAEFTERRARVAAERREDLHDRERATQQAIAEGRHPRRSNRLDPNAPSIEDPDALGRALAGRVGHNRIRPLVLDNWK
ncbi:hypothetical protein ACPYO6_08095 [Georgenia sp. Z1344]|uniref:hypothetical protein n=1 Tax=Georgenia sp. Z1344 TaxID=3416706 RepID=UPI003CE6C452